MICSKELSYVLYSIKAGTNKEAKVIFCHHSGSEEVLRA